MKYKKWISGDVRKKAVEWLTRCDGWAWAGFPFGRVNYLTTANRWAAIRNSFPLLVIIGQSLTEVITINLIIDGQTKVKFLSKSLRISKNSNKNFLEGGKSRKLESFDRYGNIYGLSNSFVPRDIWQKHCKLPDKWLDADIHQSDQGSSVSQSEKSWKYIFSPSDIE